MSITCVLCNDCWEIDWFDGEHCWISQTNWAECIHGAACGGHLDNIKYAYDRYLHEWHHQFGDNSVTLSWWICLNFSSMYGHLNIIKWLRDIVGDFKELDWNKCISNASQYGYIDIIKWVRELEVNKEIEKLDWDECIETTSNHLNIIEYIESFCDNIDWNKCSKSCVYNIDIVKYCVLKGANNFAECLEKAKNSKDYEMIHYFQKF